MVNVVLSLTQKQNSNNDGSPAGRTHQSASASQIEETDDCSTSRCHCQCTWSDMVWSIGMATVCLLATVGFAHSVLTLRNWSQFREPWSAGVIRGDFLAESIVSGRNSYDFYLIFVNFKFLDFESL